MSVLHIKYRPDIDVLRAIAVISVIFYHTFPTYLPGGFAGVDIFFVISGFLITSNILSDLQKGTFDFVDFYMRRIARIFPALLLVLIGTFVFGWFYFLADELKNLGRHISAASLFASNFLLLTESGYFDKAAELKPLLHLWSLGIEEQFYIVWPLLLFFCWKRKRSLVTIVAIIIFLSFFYTIYSLEKDVDTTFYSPLTRAWELMTGALIACLPKNLQRDNSVAQHSKQNMLCYLSGAVLILATFALLKGTMPFPGWRTLFPVGGAALMLWSGRVFLADRQFSIIRVFVWIGKISFPLYLWHWPLLLALRVTGENNNPTWRAGALLLSVFLAWLTYRLIETPIRKCGSKKLSVTVLLALMMLAGLIGHNAFSRNGYTFRYQAQLLQQLPADLKALYQPVNFEFQKNVRSGQCHIEKIDGSRRPDLCIEPARPLLAIWGDSHAAALYQGLQPLQKSQPFGIAQVTAGSCPPLIIFSPGAISADCNQNNQAILNQLLNAKPDYLVLHAAWQQYGLQSPVLQFAIQASIKSLRRQLPLTKIIVIGPLPDWEESPQRSAYLYWRRAEQKPSQIPLMLSATVPRVTDDAMHQALQGSGVRYVSALDILCSGAKCLSRTGPRPIDFIAVDNGHLSQAGANFLIQKIQSSIFAP